MSLSTVNWKALQNGSDLRGVALPGIPNEAVNLALWLAQQREKSRENLIITL